MGSGMEKRGRRYLSGKDRANEEKLHQHADHMDCPALPLSAFHYNGQNSQHILHPQEPGCYLLPCQLFKLVRAKRLRTSGVRTGKVALFPSLLTCLADSPITTTCSCFLEASGSGGHWWCRVAQFHVPSTTSRPTLVPACTRHTGGSFHFGGIIKHFETLMKTRGLYPEMRTHTHTHTFLCLFLAGLQTQLCIRHTRGTLQSPRQSLPTLTKIDTQEEAPKLGG